ncbi:MAG: hypothetical protein KC620_02040, partial [Myxococcales bacterium]|nr:hypothetical protein [Myxococcales bacterium]
MFETASHPQFLDPKTYDAEEPHLRRALLDAQFRLRQAPFSVLALFAGVEKAGTGDTVNRLNAWMDPRWLDTLAYGARTDEERSRPFFWRFWRDLPPHGRLALRFGAWYTRPMTERVTGRIGAATFVDRLDEIADFESLLAANGTLIIKFWMHLSADAQKQRLETLAADPLLSWRVTERDWNQYRRHTALTESGRAFLVHARQ